MTELLCGAKINKLVNIRRTPVGDDDMALSGGNSYHELKFSTNTLAGIVLHPYQFELECFSGELASILEGLYKSPYALSLKSISVEPLVAVGTEVVEPPPPEPEPVAPPAEGQPTVPAYRGYPYRPTVPTAPAAPEMKTVLAERLLKVILLLEAIQPGNFETTQPGS